MVLALVVLTSCAQRTYHIRMKEQGGSPERTFRDSAPSSKELRSLADRYGHTPVREQDSGEFEFKAEFDTDLPRELGGQNGWSRLDGMLGHTTMWYEIAAPTRNVWPRLVNRIESGILWLRMLKRWATVQFGQENAEAIDRVFEEQVIPDVIDGYLQFIGAGSIMASQRVGLSLRRQEDTSALTQDELFRLEVLVPIIFEMAANAPMEPNELHQGFLLGIDGSNSSQERRRAWQKSGEKVALRFLQQIDPDRTSVTMNEIRAWGISFLFFTTQTGRYKDLLLESPAVSEQEKNTLREGGTILPPAPFGVRLLGRRAPDRATIELEPSARPFLTNGIFVKPEDQGEAVSTDGAEILKFQMPIRDEDSAALFGTPPAYAFWSTPDVARQEALFGAVRIEGRELALVTGWESLLSEEVLTQWQDAVEQGVRMRSSEPIQAFLATQEGQVPAPLEEACTQAPAENEAPAG